MTYVIMLFPKPWKSKKWNTKRHISKKLKEDIVYRDLDCIICWDWIQVVHHCYFWDQAMYWEDRNDIKYCCGLCNNCHHQLHFEWGNTYRQDCIDYITNYYAK